MLRERDAVFQLGTKYIPMYGSVLLPVFGPLTLLTMYDDKVTIPLGLLLVA